MFVQVDIPQLEDEVLNALNSILMICYGDSVYEDVEKEIMRVVEVLEKKHLINKRIIPNQINCPDKYYTA